MDGAEGGDVDRILEKLTHLLPADALTFTSTENPHPLSSSDEPPPLSPPSVEQQWVGPECRWTGNTVAAPIRG